MMPAVLLPIEGRAKLRVRSKEIIANYKNLQGERAKAIDRLIAEIRDEFPFAFREDVLAPTL